MCLTVCSALQTGIQEKTTLVQLMRKLSAPQLRGATITLPAALLLMLAALGVLVMYHHTDAQPANMKGTDDSALLESGPHEASASP